MVTHAKLTADLIARWPEHRIAPSTARVEALLELLGDPHRAVPVIQVAGTNGKGSTAIMIDALLRSAGLRTGRFSSPHLSDLLERICIDGEPVSEERFGEVYADIEPYLAMVDDRQIDGVQMTFFEVMTVLAYAAFADAPVDVAIMEVGLGGTWDATSVADPQVAVVCPIDLDHTHILGNTLTEIAQEKAGIIKPGSVAVLAGQQPEAARVLLGRATEVGAKVLREGVEFGLLERSLAVGGQLLRIETSDGPVGDLYLPLHGEHMARNASLAYAAVEAFLGGKALGPQVVSDGFAEVTAPARLELIRRSPAVVLDTAHNPHGVTATMAAVREAYDFSPLVVVMAAMADKDVAGMLEIISSEADQIVVTQVASTDRGMDVEELAMLAEQHWEQVHRASGIPEAIERAIALVDDAGTHGGVLVVGSVIAAGEARTLFGGDPRADND